MTCQCNLSELLQQSIALIDPPARHPTNGSDLNAVPCSPVLDPAQASTAVAADDDADEVDEGSTASLHESNVKKKVRFSKCCKAPKKTSISSTDAVRAYELLMHAASSISLLFPASKDSSTRHFSNKIENKCIKYIDTSSSWETINDVADVYRALLIVSCLLIELLPLAQEDDTSASSASSYSLCENDASDVKSKTHLARDQCTALVKHDNYCPRQHSNNYSQRIMPTLTPSTTKEFLSTSRQCIHQLQLVERICAIKTISEKRFCSRNNSSSSSSSSNIALVHEGGDDIHDYDRPISDWYANYDWHDDGFLPLPFFHRTDERVNMDGTCYNNISSRLSQTPNDRAKSNILYECCYLPQYPTDPPSSRFEKVAWTRNWIRGQRLVSLRMEDYQCSNDGIDTSDCCEADTETAIYRDEGESISDEEHVSLDISSAAWAEEESCLIDIMLVGEVPATHNGPNSDMTWPSSKKRAGDIKEIRKKKRLKLKQKKALTEKRDLATVFIDQNLNSQSIRGKEGFLLLLHEETNGGILPHLFVDKVADTIRVFARLRPCGWLSLEDRSIRRQDCTVDTVEGVMQLRPLVPRVRYFDFFVGPTTTCQPWVRNGATSFHFRLADLHLLGSSSSLYQCFADDNASNLDTRRIESVDLLFGVDEETGGDFADGFEWVNCVSREPMEEFF